MTNPLTLADLAAIHKQIAELAEQIDWQISIRNELLSKCQEQQARITALEEALAFYASDNTYINWGATDPSYLNPSKITSDRGQIARDELKGGE